MSVIKKIFQSCICIGVVSMSYAIENNEELKDMTNGRSIQSNVFQSISVATKSLMQSSIDVLVDNENMVDEVINYPYSSFLFFDSSVKVRKSSAPHLVNLVIGSRVIGLCNKILQVREIENDLFAGYLSSGQEHVTNLKKMKAEEKDAYNAYMELLKIHHDFPEFLQKAKVEKIILKNGYIDQIKNKSLPNTYKAVPADMSAVLAEMQSAFDLHDSSFVHSTFVKFTTREIELLKSLSETIVTSDHKLVESSKYKFVSMQSTLRIFEELISAENIVGLCISVISEIYKGKITQNTINDLNALSNVDSKKKRAMSEFSEEQKKTHKIISALNSAIADYQKRYPI